MNNENKGEVSGGLSRVREVKNYNGFVSMKAIKPAVSANWQLSKLGF